MHDPNSALLHLDKESANTYPGHDTLLYSRISIVSVSVMGMLFSCALIEMYSASRLLRELTLTMRAS